MRSSTVERPASAVQAHRLVEAPPTLLSQTVLFILAHLSPTLPATDLPHGGVGVAESYLAPRPGSWGRGRGWRTRQGWGCGAVPLVLRKPLA